MKTPLVYALHSGNLYGTERMALATIEGLRDDFESVVFASAGPALEEAARLGFQTISFTSPFDSHGSSGRCWRATSESPS